MINNVITVFQWLSSHKSKSWVSLNLKLSFFPVERSMWFNSKIILGKVMVSTLSCYRKSFQHIATLGTDLRRTVHLFLTLHSVMPCGVLGIGHDWRIYTMQMNTPENLGSTLFYSAFPIAELVVKQLPIHPWFKIPQGKLHFSLAGWRHSAYINLINTINVCSWMWYSRSC